MNPIQVGIVLAATAALAQSQPGSAAPAFEVASIKLSSPQSTRGSAGGPGSSDPSRYSYNSATLMDLIAIGYHVKYFQISSKVPLDQNRFDFVAKLPPATTRQQFRMMLQNLLTERFHLKEHVESREFSAYELTVAKTGLKLKEAVGGTFASPQPARQLSADDGFPELPPNRPGMIARHSVSGGYMLTRLRAQQQTISALAEILPSPDEGPIVDKTGLTGKYDFTLEFTRDLPNAEPDSRTEPAGAPDLFSAIQQQLGLQLVRKKIPFDVVVVESIDKRPTEN